MKFLAFFVLGLLALNLSSFGGVDLGASARRTPYDIHMQPVKQVLGSLNGGAPTMDRVQALMREGRGFFYSYDEPYVAQMPEVTAAKHAGDCKAKALWLISQLGDSNARFVVGKAQAGAKLSHAWVLWKEAASGRWFILDCTNNSRAIPAESAGTDTYVPLYSYSKTGSYLHATTLAEAQPVAGKRTTPGVAAGKRSVPGVATGTLASR